MQPRVARIGARVSAVRLVTDESVSYRADSVTVTPAGVLFLAVEVPPPEGADFMTVLRRLFVQPTSER
jgi:hypothetical protein